MRVDEDIYHFSGVAQGGALAVLDLEGARSVMVGVNITTITGSPTMVVIRLGPVEGMSHNIEFLNATSQYPFAFVSGTPVTAPVKLIINQREFNWCFKAGNVLPPPFKYVDISVYLEAGSSPTVSGDVYVWSTRS